MLARRLTTILPDLTLADALVTALTMASPAAPGGALPLSPPDPFAPPTTPVPM
jgi:hypothetical protein